MQRKVFYRPLTVGIITLAFCLLVAALLTATPTDAQTRTPLNSQSPVASFRDLPKSTAAYNGVITPSTTLYAPWFLGSTSALRVYNAGLDTAVVRAAFYFADGVTTTQKSLAAGAIGQLEPVGVLTGTQLTVILTSSQPIVAVVNDFGTDGTLAASYTAMPSSLGQTSLALPSIFYESGGGWSSTPIIQNVGTTTTSVTIRYTRTNEITTTFWTDDSVTDLAPKQVHAFDPGDAGLPTDFTGIATIESDEPVLAIVHNGAVQVGSLYPRHAYVYRVSQPSITTGGDRALYYPILVDDYEGWERSEIHFMNASATSATVALEIDGAFVEMSPINPWQTGRKGQGNTSEDPEGWVGAGRGLAAPSLHSLVWLTGDFLGDAWAAYSPPVVGARTWYLPYTDQQEALNTWVAVQNVTAGSTAQITLTYHNLTGTATVVPGDPIDPFNMDLYPTPLLNVASGVVVEADQPVAAIAVIAGKVILDKTIYLPVVAKNS